mgnify:CR=1 FL=1
MGLLCCQLIDFKLVLLYDNLSAFMKTTEKEKGELYEEKEDGNASGDGTYIYPEYGDDSVSGRRNWRGYF